MRYLSFEPLILNPALRKISKIEGPTVILDHIKVAATLCTYFPPKRPYIKQEESSSKLYFMISMITFMYLLLDQGDFV